MYSTTRKPWLVMVVVAIVMLQQYAWIGQEPKRILQNLWTETSYLKLAHGESESALVTADFMIPEGESESTMESSNSTFEESESEATVVPTNDTALESEFQSTEVSPDSTFQETESKSKLVSSNSSFLGCVLPQPDLPVCSSGQDFLSIEKGGFWKYEPSFLKDKSLFDGFEFKNHIFRAPCDFPEYADPYVWSASCSVPAASFADEQPVRILLSGDSLMKQVHDTSLVANVHPLIEFSNHYTIPLLKSVNFTSKVCAVCGDALRERPSDFDKDLVWLDDDEYLTPYWDYDFVFYNEFAHFSGTMVGGILRTYEESLPDGEDADEGYVADLMEELYSWFDRQMTRKAEVFKQIEGKVYYLTSPAHAYQYIVAMDDDSQAMDAPLSKPTREASSQDCYSHGDAFGGAFCYSNVNSIATRAFQASGHGILPMDLAMGQRVDAHPCRVPVDLPDGSRSGDCLHYCLPGPPSVMLASMVVEVLVQKHLEAHI